MFNTQQQQQQQHQQQQQKDNNLLGGYLFLSTSLSNFRFFEIKPLVHRISKLRS